MITPANMTIAEYNDAIATESAVHARVTFQMENIVFEDSEFDYSTGITISSYMNPDLEMKFGTAFCREVVVNFIRSDKTDNLNWSNEFKLEFGVDNGDDIEWVTMGYFTGTRPTWDRRDVVELIAYDRMTRFEMDAKGFINDITYPCTLQDIYDDLCSYVVTDNVAGDEIASVMSTTFSSSLAIPENISCRQLLTIIAKANGCYARIDNEGKVKLVWFKDHTSDYRLYLDDCFGIDVTNLQIKTKAQWKSLEDMQWQDVENVIYKYYDNDNASKLLVKSVSFSWQDENNTILITQPAEGTESSWAIVKGSTNTWNTIKANLWGFYRNDSDISGNTYTIENNPFIYHSTEAAIRNHLQSILNQIYSFSIQYVANVNAVGNWLVEAGDVILLEVEEDKVMTKYPVFNQVIVWNGACTSEYETTGSNKAEDIIL